MQDGLRRLGVMGGTFDPIHYGHLVAASEVAHRFALDEVVFVRGGRPWQRDRHVSAAEDRYLMTVIATASNPRFSVSRVDIDRAGPTYTRDTLRDLHALNPDSELYFITGADALASILSWQGWEELFDLARFVGVSRPGFELRNDHITSVLGELEEHALTLVEIPALAISSTECRERAEQRRPLWYLMPDGVVQYVSKRRLYRRTDGPGEKKAVVQPTSLPAGNNA
jgi:nicotinate-nucleotide adenylyltransferase